MKKDILFIKNKKNKFKNNKNYITFHFFFFFFILQKLFIMNGY